MSMASKVQLQLDYSKIREGSHDDLYMLQCYESVADHLPKVKAMEIRDEDIILCAYPKSGRHWLFRVIDMLQRGQVMFDKRMADDTFIDLQQIDRLVELDSPRLLNTHLPFDLLPQEAKDKRTKIVHVYRNPRAVMVSLHFHMLALGDRKEDWSLEKMTTTMFSGQMPYRGWFNYMESIHAYQKENPDHPIFDLSYEEMSSNPLDTVKRLAEFLDKTGPPELYSGIVEACSFKKQKESEEAAKPTGRDLGIYRKGDMNDWKNYITVALNEKFDQVLKDREGKCPFATQYFSYTAPLK